MPFWLLPALLGAGIGGGLGFIRNRDPKEALLGALLGGVTGGAGSALFGGGAAASAASAGAKGLTQAASQSALASAMPNAAKAAAYTAAQGVVPQAATQTATQALSQAAAKTAGQVATSNGGGLSGIASWARKHPMLLTAGLAAPAFFGGPSDPGVQDEDPEYQHYEPTTGPRYGYTVSSVEPEDYLTYGQPGAVNEDEFQFFGPADRLRARLAGQGYADGGLIVGPGGPKSDKVPAMGPGGEPVRLSNGEYVLSAEAVQNAGGPQAIDRLHAALRSGVEPTTDDMVLRGSADHFGEMGVAERLRAATGGMRRSENVSVYRGQPSDWESWGHSSMLRAPLQAPSYSLRSVRPETVDPTNTQIVRHGGRFYLMPGGIGQEEARVGIQDGSVPIYGIYPNRRDANNANQSLAQRRLTAMLYNREFDDEMADMNANQIVIGPE